MLRNFPILGYFFRLLLFLYLETSFVHTWKNRLGSIFRHALVEESRTFVEDVAPCE